MKIVSTVDHRIVMNVKKDFIKISMGHASSVIILVKLVLIIPFFVQVVQMVKN